MTSPPSLRRPTGPRPARRSTSRSWRSSARPDRQQRQAVTHGDGPLLVLAGPGAGKTHVVTRRIAWPIATKRARAGVIPALTFTPVRRRRCWRGWTCWCRTRRTGHPDLPPRRSPHPGPRPRAWLPGEPRVVSRTEAILLGGAIDRLALRHRLLADPTRHIGALVDLAMRASGRGAAADFMALRLP
jgi:hypothetical protein